MIITMTHLGKENMTKKEINYLLYVLNVGYAIPTDITEEEYDKEVEMQNKIIEKLTKEL